MTPNEAERIENRLTHFESKLDSLGERLSDKIDAQNDVVHSRINDISSRLTVAETEARLFKRLFWGAVTSPPVLVALYHFVSTMPEG